MKTIISSINDKTTIHHTHCTNVENYNDLMLQKLFILKKNCLHQIDV